MPMPTPADLRRQKFDGVLIVEDGDQTPKTCVVPFFRGDLSISGAKPYLREPVFYSANGESPQSQYGARTEVTATFSADIAEYSSATRETVMDIFNGAGTYAGAVDTDPTQGAHTRTLKLNHVVDGNILNTWELRSVVLVSADPSQGEPDSISITVRVLGAVIFDSWNLLTMANEA